MMDAPCLSPVLTAFSSSRITLGSSYLNGNAQDLGDISGGQPYQPDSIDGQDLVEVPQAALALNRRDHQRSLAGLLVELRELLGGVEAPQVDQPVPVVPQAHQFLHLLLGADRHSDGGGSQRQGAGGVGDGATVGAGGPRERLNPDQRRDAGAPCRTDQVGDVVPVMRGEHHVRHEGVHARYPGHLHHVGVAEHIGAQRRQPIVQVVQQTVGFRRGKQHGAPRRPFGRIGPGEMRGKCSENPGPTHSSGHCQENSPRNDNSLSLRERVRVRASPFFITIRGQEAIGNSGVSRNSVVELVNPLFGSSRMVSLDSGFRRSDESGNLHEFAQIGEPPALKAAALVT